jgi:hypothetical protein
MKKRKRKRKFIRKLITIAVLTYSTRYGRIIYQTFDVDINPIQEVHVIRKQLSQSSRAVLETRRGMGLPIPVQVARAQTSNEDPFEVKSAPTVSPRLDKIRFVKPSELSLWVYIIDERVIRTPKISKLIKKLRGGSLIETVGALILIVVMCQILGGIQGFVLPNPGWGVDRDRLNPFQPTGGLRYPPVYDLLTPARPGSTLQVTRPTAMPHEEFVGLTKEEQRALPHINDTAIIHEGRPELEVGFWQSDFKVGDHGAVHDLPYTVKSNGGTKTEKTNDNTLEMIRSIVNMPNRDNVQWFEDGTYQGATDRGFEAIHIYDLDKKVIAVFRKSTGKFVTTCQLLDPEHDELINTGNFGGKKGWLNGQVKNLPPQQTAVNTFESDVMGITPIDNSQLDNP